MPSVLIDRKTKKIISIVEGQKLSSTEEYEVYQSESSDPTKIFNELESLNILGETVHFDVLFKRDALGDVLMLMPVIAGLKKSHSYLKIALQTDEWLVPLFKNNPIFDSVIGFNTLINSDYEINLCSIGDYIAKKDGRENKHRTFYYEDYSKDKLKKYEFVLDYTYDLVFEEPPLPRGFKKRMVVLAPESKSYFRMWGYREKNKKNYYKELELVYAYPDWNFVILGVNKLIEFDGIENVTNMSGLTDILECATICNSADFGIVPDSGIMHLMEKMEKPVIAIFGNVTEPEYRVSQYSTTIIPMITNTTKYDLQKYKNKPYCHIKCCWDGQIHNCIGTDHEKWCTKEITVENIINVYETKVKSKLKLGVMKPYEFKKYNIVVSSSGTVSKYFNEQVRGVMYIGQYGTSGYAIATKGYIVDMTFSDIPVKWIPITHEVSVNYEDECIYSTLARSRINKNIDTDVMIIHEPPIDWKNIYEHYNTSTIKKVIGYTVWETETLPTDWVNYMNADFIDEIWCPTEYNKRVFEKSGVDADIRVVPHVWLGKDLPNVIQSENFVFYNISEFTERKGVKDLINTFCEEFTKNDKVELLFKTHYRGYNSESIDFVKNEYRKLIMDYKNIPKITVLFDHLSEKEILEMHAYGDCYYSPCRSEGFGLPIYDAFNYGNSVVATGYGGHVEYLGREYNGLIDYTMGEVKNMKDFAGTLYENQMWAYPDLNHAKNLLRDNYVKWLTDKEERIL